MICLPVGSAVQGRPPRSLLHGSSNVGYAVDDNDANEGGRLCKIADDSDGNDVWWSCVSMFTACSSCMFACVARAALEKRITSSMGLLNGAHTCDVLPVTGHARSGGPGGV